jgi:hypothetical protein
MRNIPQQDYIPDISSGRGPDCNELIPCFFRLLATLFVGSGYVEKYLVRITFFARTSICESYINWEVIMISKVMHFTASEYIRKEMATYISFVSRQSEKLLLSKKLVKGKYHNTFTVSAGQKNGRHEKHILHGVLIVAGSDPVVRASVEFFEAKRQRRLDRRVVLSNKSI